MSSEGPQDTRDESPWRKHTTDLHPLFAGNPRQYHLDQEWRRFIPKAGWRPGDG